jgi:hypothetical protein
MMANYMREITSGKTEEEAKAMRADLRAASRLLIQLFRDDDTQSEEEAA